MRLGYSVDLRDWFRTARIEGVLTLPDGSQVEIATSDGRTAWFPVAAPGFYQLDAGGTNRVRAISTRYETLTFLTDATGCASNALASDWPIRR